MAIAGILDEDSRLDTDEPHPLEPILRNTGTDDVRAGITRAKRTKSQAGREDVAPAKKPRRFPATGHRCTGAAGMPAGTAGRCPLSVSARPSDRRFHAGGASARADPATSPADGTGSGTVPWRTRRGGIMARLLPAEPSPGKRGPRPDRWHQRTGRQAAGHSRQAEIG
ncbi:hypothetical protein Rmf_15030 [Roseomonas fluvialis]|uniref:Uncharacterized protein n=1 Tax=Roseomonas fluvialis TaxID=1750527 RepID=A0ABM7Y190_9PROT|nr:hypothetical protein Rmf_15030 [Roseomonas fluvialis]